MSKKKKDTGAKKGSDSKIIDDKRPKIEQLLECLEDNGDVIMPQYQKLIRTLCVPNVSSKDRLRIELLIEGVRRIKLAQIECAKNNNEESSNNNTIIDINQLNQAFEAINSCINTLTDNPNCQMPALFAQFTNTLRSLRSCEIPPESLIDYPSKESNDNVQSLPRLMIEKLTLFFIDYFVEHFDLYRQALSKQHLYQSEWISFQKRCPIGSFVAFKPPGINEQRKNHQPIWKVKRFSDVSLENHYVELEMVQWLPHAIVHEDDGDPNDDNNKENNNNPNDKDIQTEVPDKLDKEGKDEMDIKDEMTTNVDPFQDYTDFHGRIFMISSSYVHMLHPQMLTHIPTPEPPSPKDEIEEENGTLLESSRNNDDEKTEQQLEEEDLDRKVEIALNKLRENFKMQLEQNEQQLQQMLATVTAESMEQLPKDTDEMDIPAAEDGGSATIAEKK